MQFRKVQVEASAMQFKSFSFNPLSAKHVSEVSVQMVRVLQLAFRTSELWRLPFTPGRVLYLNMGV